MAPRPSLPQRPALALAVLALAATQVACGPAAAPPAGAPKLKPIASVQDLMKAEVDPSADALWGAVAFTADLHGHSERQPRTEEDWSALRRSAVVLAEAANLLATPGRQAATGGQALADAGAPGALSAAEVQTHLQRNHAAFAANAAALQAVALDATAAIDAKDPARLQTVGGRIDEACEACHLQFWYPPR